MRVCADCKQPIHALDGSSCQIPGPWRHGDCEQAAKIDYAAAFDKLYGAVCDAAHSAWRLMDETAEDNDAGTCLEATAERLVVGLATSLGDATAWRSYEQERSAPK